MSEYIYSQSSFFRYSEAFRPPGYNNFLGPPPLPPPLKINSKLEFSICFGQEAGVGYNLQCQKNFGQPPIIHALAIGLARFMKSYTISDRDIGIDLNKKSN